MSRLLLYVLIAVIMMAHGPAAWAQGRPGETEARKEAARRTWEIMEMRRRMAEEARVRARAIIRLHTEGKFTHPPKSDLNWRAEPRGGWTIETEPDWDPTARAWNGFASDMSEFLGMSEEISHYRFATMSEPWAVKSVEKRSKDLQKRVEAILRFLLDGRLGWTPRPAGDHSPFHRPDDGWKGGRFELAFNQCPAEDRSGVGWRHYRRGSLPGSRPGAE